MKNPILKNGLKVGALLAGLSLVAGCNLGALLNGLDFGALELQSGQSCAQLESSLKERALSRIKYASIGATSSGTAEPAAPSGSSDFKGTNSQENAVDEADILEVDGEYAYSIAGDELVIVNAPGSMGAARVVGRMTFDYDAFAMFVSGDRAVVLSHATHSQVKDAFQADSPDRDSNLEVTRASVIDISDRANPKLLRELFVEGKYIAARRVDEQVYIVSRAILDGPKVDGNPGTDAYREAYEEAVEKSTIDDWMPYYYDLQYRGGRVEKKAAHCSCGDTYTEPASDGNEMLAVYSLNMKDGESSIETATVLGSDPIVYASTKNLYVALKKEELDSFGDSFGSDNSLDSGWADDELTATYPMVARTPPSR